MNIGTKTIFKTAGILFIGILLGWLMFGNEKVPDASFHDHSETQQVWTCSMHPQIRQPEGGSCPICGMDLIPMDHEKSPNESINYQMSADAMKLANVQTIEVGKGDTGREIRLNGKVQVDESNSYSQSTHIPGRIEQLSINFTGQTVRYGQTLATVFSPELVTAQEELLQAAGIRESQPELYEAAKQKLRNWKIAEAQIDQILNDGKALDRFSIRADVSGIVTEKMVDLGDYVDRGMPLYEISDLSKVWVLFDLYEGQLSGVKEGDEVAFTINSYPGETFEGAISFVDPILDTQTRVATARVEVGNEDDKLKPGMFASGIVKNSGRGTDSEKLVIPKSAVLWTGKRSIVYVVEELNSSVGFKLREITLGTSLGDSYVVEAGLEPGENIVSNGAFTVDAAVQLSGRPSMMNPEAAGSNENSIMQMEISSEVKTELKEILSSYLALKDALVEDDVEAARKLKLEFQKAVEASAGPVNPDASEKLARLYSALKSAAKRISSSSDISSMRKSFNELSVSMIALVKNFQMDSGTLYLHHCPMADNDKGANWLSTSAEVRNPYYGRAMLACGEVTEVLD